MSGDCITKGEELNERTKGEELNQQNKIEGVYYLVLSELKKDGESKGKDGTDREGKKREEGLIRKPHEFNTLCDVKSCMIIYNQNQSPEIWPL